MIACPFKWLLSSSQCTAPHGSPMAIWLPKPSGLFQFGYTNFVPHAWSGPDEGHRQGLQACQHLWQTASKLGSSQLASSSGRMPQILCWKQRVGHIYFLVSFLHSPSQKVYQKRNSSWFSYIKLPCHSSQHCMKETSSDHDRGVEMSPRWSKWPHHVECTTPLPSAQRWPP